MTDVCCVWVLWAAEDPIGLLPPRLILGINKRGVHFFRPVPKEYLHSAELRDIMQVGGAGVHIRFVPYIGACIAQQVRIFRTTTGYGVGCSAGSSENFIVVYRLLDLLFPSHCLCLCPVSVHPAKVVDFLSWWLLAPCGVCVVVLQFGSSSQAVFFKMRVAGVLHIFQFETRQGEDICMALQTHINDIMMKRYSKVRYLQLPATLNTTMLQ